MYELRSPVTSIEPNREWKNHIRSREVIAGAERSTGLDFWHRRSSNCYSLIWFGFAERPSDKFGTPSLSNVERHWMQILKGNVVGRNIEVEFQWSS